MSIEVEEIQALFRLFNLPELRPVEFGGSCSDCIHGHGVHSGVTGLWPIIDDCKSCLSPSHPHFIPYKDLHLYIGVSPEDVFNIPTGGTIPIYMERIRRGMEGKYDYANTGGWCVRVSDSKRICRMKSLTKLDIPGNQRR